ncbi:MULTISPECIES: AAA family ATPase [Streptomyces]|uniref:ATP-binding protein n=1 Tax=Streptomyces TaxID=1883 RepID=UPI000BFB43A8|nr:AAA family ATPase [Streptomyces sp. or3]WTC72409.1 AAA family ATPase [Streptomyces anulatus]
MTPALFGRDHPAGVLRSEIARATDSHGGLVLVTGEAGIGKSTLVTDAAHEARRRGALVVGGSCWDSDNTPGYWPWVQILRGLRRSATAAEWAAAQEASDGRLAVLLGDPVRVAMGGTDGPGPSTLPGAAPGAAGAPGSDGAHGGEPGTEAGTSPPGGGPPEGAEAFGLFDAVTTALVTVSQSRPLVVVLDDLHSSDPASLRLLEFAAQHAWFERLLLIGTYRDVEVDAPGHPLQQLILPLVSRAATTLTLTGLGRDEVGALMTVTTGREPSPQLIDEVHRRTGGNPFFVEQTARLWHSGSPVSTIPPGVREAVRQRLALLPEPVVSLLTSAALLGREFRRQVLAVVHGSPAPHVDRLLEPAVVARVVVPRPSGQYAFAHDLLRETLYASLDEAEARERHAAAVRSLDAHGGLGDAVRPGALARHAHLAGSALDRDRRIDLLLAAARDASGRLADEEAVGHYRRALAVASGEPGESGESGESGQSGEPGGPGASAGPEGPGRPGERRETPGGTSGGVPACGPGTAGAPGTADGTGSANGTGTADGTGTANGTGTADTEDRGPDLRRAVLIGLDLSGQLRHAGETAEAQRLLDRSVTLARELDEPELLARVAITLHRDGSLGSRDVPTMGLLAEAHHRITGKEGQESLSDDRLAQELAIHIMALARDGSDDEALAFSLWARHDSVWGLGSAMERLGLTDEMTVVGRRTQHQDMELHATSMRWVALLELGDPAFIDQFRAFVRLAELTELPRFALGVAVDTSLIAALQGRFAEASTALEDDALDPENNDHVAFGFMGHHLSWALHLLQGHFAEAEEVLGLLPGAGYPYPGLLEAVTAVEQGDATPALRLIAEQSDRAAPYPRAFMPLWLRLLAQTAAITGDPRLITRAEDELTPYTGQWIVSLYGCDIGGPVDLWLGMLAAARDDRDAAVAALTEAAASSDRLGARPWAVRARLCLARSLLARAGAAGGGVAGGGVAGAEGAGAGPGAGAVRAGGAGDSAGDAGQARRLLAEVAREAGELAMTHVEAEITALRTAPPSTADPTPTATTAAATDASTTPRPAASDPAVSGPAAPWAQDPGAAPVRGTEGPSAGAPAGSSAGASVGTPTGTRAVPSAEFRRNGPVWQLRWDGVTVHVPDAKGLRDLHSLLGLPGTDVPAVQLLAPEGGDLVVAAGQLGGDPVLDEEAKRRYKEHLARLDAEIDRAAARDDARGVEKYDRERQALLDQLRSAAGLGGRTRRLGDQTERARKTVTARIRDTLRKLDTLHPALAAHLKASVTTGTTCAYRPEHSPDWRL